MLDRISRLLVVFMLLIFLSQVSVLAQEGQPLEILNITINPDPLNPLLSRIEFKHDGPDQLESLELYGNKATEGEPVAESALMYVTNVDRPALIHFDQFGRPGQMHMPDGTLFSIEYQLENAFVHYITPQGNFGVLNLPLDEEMNAMLADIVSRGLTGQIPLVDRKEIDEAAISIADNYQVSPPTINQTDTRAIQVTRVAEIKFDVMDEAGQIHALGVHNLKISCPPFDCKVISATYPNFPIVGPTSRTLTIRLLISSTLQAPANEIIERADACEVQERNNSLLGGRVEFGVGFLGGAISLFSTVCPNLAPLAGPGLIAGLATVGLLIAFEEINPSNKPTCIAVASEQVATRLLSSVETTIQIEPQSSPFLELEPTQASVSSFAPFSHAGPWTKNEPIVLRGRPIANDQLQIAPQAPNSRTQQTVSVAPLQQSALELCPVDPGCELSPVNGQVPKRPHPFFSPSDYESVCVGTEEPVIGPAWKLVQVVPNPDRSPMRWDSPAAGFQGSFSECRIGSSSMTAHMFSQTTAGVFLSEADVTYSFDAPPRVIAAGGTTPPLQMNAKITGKVEGAACPAFFAHYLRSGNGNRVSPNISVLSVCRAILEGPSEFEAMPVIRAPLAGATFSVASRLLLNNVGCKAEWTYQFIPEN